MQASRSSGALTELITTFNLSLTATVQEVCNAATRAELNTKSWNELVWSFEALKRWGDELENRFGTLTRIDHHSPPDDPPDITLHFARADIPWEHTLLEPYPLRWAQDIRGNRGGFVPLLVERNGLETSYRTLYRALISFGAIWPKATKPH